MVFRKQLFRQVTIIGVGLLGGSLGMAVKKHQIARKVVGYSRDGSTLEAATKRGAIDEGSSDIAKSVAGSDLVLLCAPVEAIKQHFDIIGSHLKRNCIVTDVGSTKASIVETAHRVLPRTALYVGSHPLAGSEKKGVEHAEADLFANATCLMTPTDATNRLAREKVKQLWTLLGCQVKFLGPTEHDEALAYVSHLPHIAAFGLMEAIPAEYLEHGSQGLKDATRIAGSSARMWSDICLDNQRNVLKAIDEHVKKLGQIRRAVVDKNEKDLMDIFRKAKEKRDKLV